MKYGIQVWGDWDGVGEETPIFLIEGSANEGFSTLTFDTAEEAEHYMINWNVGSYVVAPLPDALCGRTEDAKP